MKLCFMFFLLLRGMAVCQRREYVYSSENMNWYNAQKYCKENYVDLATITTEDENQRLKETLGLSSVTSWIGLNRIAPGSNIWQWSDGEPPSFFNWIPGQPDYWQNAEDCTIVETRGWNDKDCRKVLPFFCSWRFVLVKDSKTWQEALNYCRTYYTGLASPISQQQLSLAKNATAQSQTVSVWTGLHFMNGQWVSMNRVPLGRQVLLPSCPAPRYRCGALNTEAGLSENRDCNEKLNFLCY